MKTIKTATATKSASKNTTAKTVAAKTAKKTVIARKTNLFTLAAKVNVEDFGTGQRAAIAKLLKKTGGATRASLIAALPDVPPANISWHLSMMVADKTAKKATQK